MLRVKHDIWNKFASIAVYFDFWYLTLIMSNNCACNATRHEARRRSIKTALNQNKCLYQATLFKGLWEKISVLFVWNLVHDKVKSTWALEWMKWNQAEYLKTGSWSFASVLGTGQKLEGGGLVHFYFGLPVLGRPSPFQVQKKCWPPKIVCIIYHGPPHPTPPPPPEQRLPVL